MRSLKRREKAGFTESEAKQWARGHDHRLFDTTSPSFIPDLTELDEEEFYVGRLNYAKGMRLKY